MQKQDKAAKIANKKTATASGSKGGKEVKVWILLDFLLLSDIVFLLSVVHLVDICLLLVDNNLLLLAYLGVLLYIVLLLMNI